MIFFNILYLTGALYVLYSSLYLLFFSMMFFVKIKNVADIPQINKKFLILVPAHNEEKVIETLLNSIRALHYPEKLYDVNVICDNCTDATAAIVKNNGFAALVRENAMLKGKGHAIDWALQKIDLTQYDAVLMTDADTMIKSDILSSLSQELEDRNVKVIQCYNGVLNPDQTPLTRLMNLARALEIINMAGKSLAGLSVHLIGNGMCFRPDILTNFPWSAYSISEDLEYSCMLATAGVQIKYSYNSRVLLLEERSFSGSVTQRQRWSSGRLPLAVKFALKIFLNGVKNRDFIQAEAVNILVVPNPSLLTNLLLLLGILILFFTPWDFSVVCVGVSSLFLTGTFFSALFYVKNFKESIAGLAIAPFYLLWKGVIDILAVLGKNKDRWIKTKRD